MATKLEYQKLYTVDLFSEILLSWGTGCAIHCLENDTWWSIHNNQLVQQDLSSPSNHVVIKSALDFPTPDINGFIQLVDSTTYQITGIVSGGFKFLCGVKSSFVGIDRVNDKLLSTTTGTMFTMDGTTTTKSNILFGDITIGAVNGTLFNVTSPTANQAIGMINTTIMQTANLGTINNISTWAMTNCVMRNGATNSGFVITGNNGTIKCRLGVFSNNVGTTFDFGTSVNQVMDFNNNQIDDSIGQTFISAITGSATLLGKLNNNIFTGAGNHIVGVTENDWKFDGNLGIVNTPIVTSYVYEQSIPSDTWIVNHNLGFHPNVTVVDSADTAVIGGITYNSLNQLTLNFAAGFSGNAYLS